MPQSNRELIETVEAVEWSKVTTGAYKLLNKMCVGYFIPHASYFVLVLPACFYGYVIQHVTVSAMDMFDTVGK